MGVDRHDRLQSGYEVRGADGRAWDVKLGPEAQSEVVASRVLWAMGYHQPATYYVASWQLSGGPGGQQRGARFRLDSPDEEVVGEWAWADNAFVGTQPYRGLIAANICSTAGTGRPTTTASIESRTVRRAYRYVVRDLGASFGKTTSSRLLWVLPIPMRGFGQGSRNNIDGFESQDFIERADEGRVEFDFRTFYGSVVDLVRPPDVRWSSGLLAASPIRSGTTRSRRRLCARRFAPGIIRKIKAKIAEGLAVS